MPNLGDGEAKLGTGEGAKMWDGEAKFGGRRGRRGGMEDAARDVPRRARIVARWPVQPPWGWLSSQICESVMQDYQIHLQVLKIPSFWMQL